ncbi:hypothetical protein [Reinekea sp. G2M2-21]|uniref:hypothetical protein n=1 Tax=Reinekea sp. G2M2-21 TaxID=2788942 RepID=UPI0018A9F006|nr:hypothetical protein [Reinekea sp. G2M2-21]
MTAIRLQQFYTIVVVTWLVVLLTGCSTQSVATEPAATGDLTQPTVTAEPDIVSYLPQSTNGYQYEDFHIYDEGLGYSVRYSRSGESVHKADFYIWPVDDSVIPLEHKEKVYQVAKWSLQDIVSAQDAGLYSNIDILSSREVNSGGFVFIVIKLRLVQENLALYSLLVVTEHQGHFVKARLTLKDNDTNRARKDTEGFINNMFNVILSYLAQTSV